MATSNNVVGSSGGEAGALERDAEEGPGYTDWHKLDEVQRRACRLHHRHGATCGGYTLEEWLEAEHELEVESKGPRKDRVH